MEMDRQGGVEPENMVEQCSRGIEYAFGSVKVSGR